MFLSGVETCENGLAISMRFQPMGILGPRIPALFGANLQKPISNIRRFKTSIFWGNGIFGVAEMGVLVFGGADICPLKRH